MYALTYNNQVFLTPVKWKPRYIADVIEDDYEVTVSLALSDEQRIPFNITPEIKVLPMVEVKPDIDDFSQMYGGYTWVITDTQATATYFVSPVPVDFVRQRVKEKVATKRYGKECVGVKVTVQGQEVTAETDRETRSIFVQALMLMGEAEVKNWKFPEGFLALTKSDLSALVAAGATVVQDAFDWESVLVAEINTADYLRLKEIYDSLEESTEQPL